MASSRRPRCVVTRELPGTALERLRAVADVEVWPRSAPPEPAELRALLHDAEGLLCLLTDRIDRGVLSDAPMLRAISNYAVGVDNIDLEAARERGIAVGNTPDVLTEATAELALALIFAGARRIVEADAYVRAGRWTTWDPQLLLGSSIAGATLGIIGPGRIGRAVAERGEALGMRVLLHRHGDDRRHLRQVLAESDYVSLHCPLTPETEGLIGPEALSWMKPTAILVNTSRGRLVDLDALTSALQHGTLGGAALDTTDPEPLPAAHPLLACPTATVVPHIGSATVAARSAMADIAVDNLLRALEGLPMRHPVP